jgi:antitoxin HigA-1
MFKNGMRPVHPGEILLEDFLKPIGMTPHALSKALKVTPARVNEIVNEKRGITADTALRLARFFGGDAALWLNLQSTYALKLTQIAMGVRINKEVSTL